MYYYSKYTFCAFDDYFSTKLILNNSLDIKLSWAFENCMAHITQTYYSNCERWILMTVNNKLIWLIINKDEYFIGINCRIIQRRDQNYSPNHFLQLLTIATNTRGRRVLCMYGSSLCMKISVSHDHIWLKSLLTPVLLFNHRLLRVTFCVHRPIKNHLLKEPQVVCLESFRVVELQSEIDLNHALRFSIPVGNTGRK